MTLMHFNVRLLCMHFDPFFLKPRFLYLPFRALHFFLVSAAFTAASHFDLQDFVGEGVGDLVGDGVIGDGVGDGVIGDEVGTGVANGVGFLVGDGVGSGVGHSCWLHARVSFSAPQAAPLPHFARVMVFLLSWVPPPQDCEQAPHKPNPAES